MSLDELGKQAYQKANWNDFGGAVEILNKAILRYPKDVRLYNNRCYCYCKLKEYNKAIDDANFMVQKFPNYTKSHYRKGEVLLGLNKLVEAEKCFMAVLKIDPNCEEARAQLTDIQIKQLCMGGKYSRKEAEKALKLAFYNKHEAELLLAGGAIGLHIASDVYYSDEEILEEACIPKISTIKQTEEPSDPFTDPNNPLNCSSIWVGNVTKGISEEQLKPVFSKYGKVKNIVIQHQNFCAFINYNDPAMASKAMKLFPAEGMVIKDTSIIIRYPDSAVKNGVSLKKPNFKYT